jgi:hypothetical protein
MSAPVPPRPQADVPATQRIGGRRAPAPASPAAPVISAGCRRRPRHRRRTRRGRRPGSACAGSGRRPVSSTSAASARLLSILTPVANATADAECPLGRTSSWRTAQRPVAAQVGQIRPDLAEDPLEDHGEQQARDAQQPIPRIAPRPSEPLPQAEQTASASHKLAVARRVRKATQPAVGQRGGQAGNERMRPSVPAPGIRHAGTRCCLVETSGSGGQAVGR